MLRRRLVRAMPTPRPRPRHGHRRRRPCAWPLPWVWTNETGQKKTRGTSFLWSHVVVSLFGSLWYRPMAASSSPMDREEEEGPLLHEVEREKRRKETRMNDLTISEMVGLDSGV